MTPKPRPWLADLEPYRPGRATADDAGALASNESPLGPSPAAVAAVAAAAGRSHRYPDPLATPLREAIGGRLGVDPDSVVVGNGSDELIDLLYHAYAARGRVVVADPPFRMHELSAKAHDAAVDLVPLRSDLAHDLDAMAAVEADVVVVCNPHNPTGTVRSRADLYRFLERRRADLVVLDEAYVDFADDPTDASLVDQVGSRDDVVVLRTFSKAYGLAGLRCGYAVAPEAVVDLLRRMRSPFSVNAAAQAAALAALGDDAHLARVLDHVRAMRSEVASAFGDLGYEAVPSQANFVLVRVGDAEEEARLHAHLRDHRVFVRAGSGLGLPGSLRVTVPSEAGMAMLREALAAWPEGVPAGRGGPASSSQ